MTVKDNIVLRTRFYNFISTLLAMEQTIPEFYKGKSVFITGATGFMGKALVEKLLRSCPDLERIYILVRSKRGVSSQKRWDQIVQNNEIFKIIISENEGALKKVIVLDGDVMSEKLGLCDKDRKLLSEEVHIVFHVAASVRFNDTLAFATKMNTIGTKEVVDLALTIKNIQAFAYVSTTYCNCNRTEVYEKVYPGLADWRKTIDIVNNTDPNILELLSAKYTSPMPNTYTFTKLLSEQIISEAQEKLPVIIFRPSIVISSWHEPFPGWIDNFNGPVGILLGVGKGILRISISDLDAIPDYMPVDLAIKALIASTWKKALSNEKKVAVYNAASTHHSVSNREMADLAYKLQHETPISNIIWYPSKESTNNLTYFRIVAFFKHFLVALLLDRISRMVNIKPQLLKIQIKIHNAIIALAPFTTTEWHFHNKNFLKLNDDILTQDKKDFDYSMDGIDPYTYFKNATITGKRLLLNETDDKLPAAKQRLKIMYWLDKIVGVSGKLFLLWLSYKLFILK